MKKGGTKYLEFSNTAEQISVVRSRNGKIFSTVQLEEGSYMERQMAHAVVLPAHNLCVFGLGN